MRIQLGLMRNRILLIEQARSKCIGVYNEALNGAEDLLRILVKERSKGTRNTSIHMIDLDSRTIITEAAMSPTRAKRQLLAVRLTTTHAQPSERHSYRF